MAITVVQSPSKFTPAFNPVTFQISSTNYAQPDFKFVADVYSGTGQLLVSLKYQPQVSGSAPIEIDINRVLHELVSANYCKLNEVVTPDIVVSAAGLLSGYSVQFGEQYGGNVFANMVSFSGYIFNGAMNNKRFAFYDQANFLNERFLSRIDRQTVRKSDSVMISILQSDTVAMANFAFTIYDLAGGQLYTTNIANPYTSLATTSHRALHLHVGFDYLFARLAFPLLAYTSASYYTITPPGGTAMRIDLHSRCERFPGIRLYFLNEYGGFDAFNFTMADKPTESNEKKFYQRQRDSKRTGYDTTNKRFEATNRAYVSKYTERIRVISDYLRDDEALLLSGLVRSPLVYMEGMAVDYGGTPGDRFLVPVDMKVNEYAIKKTRLDKVFNVEFDLEFTEPNYLQST